MSLYNDLTTVLTPYANKIKQNESDISDIQDALEHLDVATDTTLTQSGAPADAKVVGDEIADLKSDLNAFDGIREVAITSQDGKKYITPSGTISSASSNYHVSTAIAVHGGEHVKFTCTVAGGNIVVVALCDKDGENIVPVVVGDNANTQITYSYYVQSNGYIMLSYRYDLDYKLIVLNNNSNVSIRDSVDTNTTSLRDQCGVNNVRFVPVNGKKYVSNNGNISPAARTFHITEPIAVKRGERVEFIAVGAATVAMISTCASDSTSITPQAVATSTDEQTYIYDVEKDGYIILSYNYSERADLYILGKIANKRLKDDVDNTVKHNSNLLNHRTLINGKTISAQGVISDNVQYAITEEIAVEESTVYSYRNIERFVYFNKAGNRIGNTNLSTYTGTITTPANTAYMIAMVMKFNSQIEKVYRSTEWQIVKGSVLPDYQQQQIIVNGYRIADSVSATHDNITAFRRWDKICFDKQPVVFAAQESDATTAEDRMTSAIIAKYDALMSANPDYITKTALGTASDGETTIYQYDFATPKAKVASGSRAISTHEKTKIILISGVHPEFGGIYGLYNAMREITNNPNLSDIKYGVHFIVIPTVNPYGIDTKNRKNANGVDIARNFEIDYVVGTNPSSNTYAGTAPLSEPESQIVDAIMSANRDAIVFASCHSFQLSSDNNVIWGSCATMHTTNIVAKLVVKMSAAWRNKYPSIVPQSIDTVLGSAGISTESGSEGKQATKYGIQGLTLETSDYFPYESKTAHTSFAMSRNSETYINFVKTVLGLYESSDPKDLNTIGIY